MARPRRLFINTVPATVRDTSFLGRGVLDYLGPTLSPRFVTLEITEGQVIANINLYREAMHSFTELGFTFAIDDLGAGYSGLETLATLGASYLKIDMGLVRDVHQKRVNQQVVKAILELGAGVGATVIAEGIETREEAETLRGHRLAIRAGLPLRSSPRSAGQGPDFQRRVGRRHRVSGEAHRGVAARGAGRAPQAQPRRDALPDRRARVADQRRAR